MGSDRDSIIEDMNVIELLSAHGYFDENSPEVIRETRNGYFSLDSYTNGHTRGICKEQYITNNTNEPLYVIDHNNNKYEILPSKSSGVDYRGSLDGRLSIFFCQKDSDESNRETNNKFDFEQIAIEKLRIKPYYCNRLNLLFTTGDFVEHVKHPFSKDAYQDTIKRHHAMILSNIVDESSIRIFAYDPKCRIKNLYIEMGSNIVTVPVLHTQSGTDAYVVIQYLQENKTYDTHTCSLEKAFEKADSLISINGLTFSVCKSILSHHLEFKRKRMTPNIDEKVINDGDFIQTKYIDRYVNKIIDEKDTEINILRKELEDAKINYKKLTDGSYIEKKSEVVLSQIEIEKMKVTESIAKHGSQLHTDRLSFGKDIVGFIGSLFKAIAVIIPAVYGIYKFFKT